ncbi:MULTISPECIES: hypothetical protein [unclassified Okeania]|nr:MULTISPECIES: hypothetical protein [unclassified Okeania]
MVKRVYDINLNYLGGLSQEDRVRRKERRKKEEEEKEKVFLIAN